jgi:hypothetical protein
MLKLGFDARWVSLIMACVCSLRYSIQFNSNIVEVFTPLRGIHQGGHISPYLFLVSAEDFEHVEIIMN